VVVSNAVQISNIAVRFGALQAVDDVTLHVDYGEVVTLLGPTARARPPSSRPCSVFVRPTPARFDSTVSTRCATIRRSSFAPERCSSEAASGPP